MHLTGRCLYSKNRSPGRQISMPPRRKNGSRSTHPTLSSVHPEPYRPPIPAARSPACTGVWGWPVKLQALPESSPPLTNPDSPSAAPVVHGPPPAAGYWSPSKPSPAKFAPGCEPAPHPGSRSGSGWLPPGPGLRLTGAGCARPGTGAHSAAQWPGYAPKFAQAAPHHRERYAADRSKRPIHPRYAPGTRSAK